MKAKGRTIHDFGRLFYLRRQGNEGSSGNSRRGRGKKGKKRSERECAGKKEAHARELLEVVNNRGKLNAGTCFKREEKFSQKANADPRESYGRKKSGKEKTKKKEKTKERSQRGGKERQPYGPYFRGGLNQNPECSVSWRKLPSPQVEEGFTTKKPVRRNRKIKREKNVVNQPERKNQTDTQTQEEHTKEDKKPSNGRKRPRISASDCGETAREIQETEKGGREADLGRISGIAFEEKEKKSGSGLGKEGITKPWIRRWEKRHPDLS